MAISLPTPVTRTLQALKRRKWLLPAAGGLVLLLLLFRREPPVEVATVHPLRQDLVETVPASGTVRPVVEVRISPEVSGEIVEICTAEGAHVAAGDVLLKIRQDLYRSQVEQAAAALGSLRAQYARQRAQERLARQNHERDRKLFDLNAISAAELQSVQTELDIAQSGLREAEYAVRSGEARLREARDNLQKTIIYAPVDGTVSQLHVEKGERVVGTSQMAGTELLRIADFSRMEVVVDVGESDVVRIACGDSVAVTLDAYPRRKCRGLVTQIANSAKKMDERFNQVTNFEVRIELMPDSVVFLPGMSAAVDIITERKSHCRTLPVACLFTRGREEFVWVLGAGRTVQARKVVTGIQERDRIEIREGLADDERVVAGPSEAIEKKLTENRRVRPSENTQDDE